MADLILYTGPMFSSKTTKLLMQADKRFYQKQNVIAFKSRMDDDCVIIDELFLIEGGANACFALYKKGYDVIVASIDLSFTGEPFHEIKEMMPYCTRIIKCKSVCSVCQKDARYTYKKISTKHVECFESDPSVEQIQVGGAELYEPRCQEHHNYMRD